VAKASTYGTCPVLIKTFLSNSVNETSSAHQISVSHTKKKILVIKATTVRKARISRFCANMAKKIAR
jgi:hypothetical protein